MIEATTTLTRAGTWRDIALVVVLFSCRQHVRQRIIPNIHECERDS
jgi:hypothetical protein